MDLPRLRQPAPHFQSKAVFNDNVFDISLNDYKQKYLVLLFFPMNFTYICPTELIAFSDHLQQFQEMNTQVVACSIESHFSHLKWLSMPHKQGGIRGLKYPLIADKSMAIAKSYGVLNAEEGTPYRAMFIIDDKSILRQITVNDHQVGRNVFEVFRLINAMQHEDKLHTYASAVTTDNVRRPRPLKCGERSSLREVIE
ncbi:unnamed protein product [Adineta ricciae]|uniref:thioredoxin-dependent peroxiredoxin n=1 Tax=Adineta ricciae TaxID=249248 RepID=A0A815LC14_ADIRI|nr:unnamed protein product [Adineta ricciae]